jgi:hypothetical protein
MASRWIDEVARLRPVQVDWRVLTAARVRHGREVLKPLYDAFGTRVHPGGSQDWTAATAAALAEVGLPADLLGEADGVQWDGELGAEHHDGMDRVGTDVGTPVIAVGDVAFFGPVVSPAPRGEAALQLWDGVLAVAGTEGFFEIKRTRTRGPDFA